MRDDRDIFIDIKNRHSHLIKSLSLDRSKVSDLLNLLVIKIFIKSIWIHKCQPTWTYISWERKTTFEAFSFSIRFSKFIDYHRLSSAQLSTNLALLQHNISVRKFRFHSNECTHKFAEWYEFSFFRIWNLKRVLMQKWKI